MTRRSLFTRWLPALPFASLFLRLGLHPATGMCGGCLATNLGRWGELPRIQPIQQIVEKGVRHTSLMMQIGKDQWRHGAVADGWWLPQGSRFVAYKTPTTSWQGWIEDSAGKVIGWVMGSGRAIATAQLPEG